MAGTESLEPFYISIFMTLLTWVTCFYDALTYIPCYITASAYRQRRDRLKAVNVGRDRSGPYRDVAHLHKLTTHPNERCPTLDAEFEYVCSKYSKLQCLGTREIYKEEDEIQPNGKSFKKLVMGEYKWQTYGEVFTAVDHLGRGLHNLGLQHKDNILIFAETRAEFQITLQACFRYAYTAVTLYSTLGEQAIIYGINETEVSFVITSASLLPKFKAIQKNIPNVKTIIYMEDQLSKADTHGFAEGLKVHSFKSVLKLGETDQDTTHTRPVLNDIALIMYTSGTTGIPKGVLLSHQNIMSVISGGKNRIPHSSGIPQPIPDETCVCFLPLAHILEVVVECILLSSGCRLGYSSPLTLSDISSKIKRGGKGDISVLQPTMMASVPLIVDRLYKGIMDKVNSSSPLQRALFKFAYDYKLHHIQQGFDTPIFNWLIFSKLRNMLGGQIRLILCGGAALSHNAQRFMQCCFCTCVLQGYGLTEIAGAVCVGEPGDFETRHTGQPLSCSEIKLQEWTEGGYTPQDKPHPRGEVLVHGANVAVGYYKNSALTDEYFKTIDGRRWFCTGDIGEMLPDGMLRITDRKKDLVKLQTGEYVSLSRIESILKKSPYVENICIYADGDFDYCVALVVPYQQNLQVAAKENGLSGRSIDEICNSGKLAQVVLVSMAKVAMEGHLQKYEIPRKLKLCAEEWLPSSGLLTEAFKLKRRALAAFYKDDIRKMYYG